MNVLIVEDEKEIADTLQYALKAEGFSVIWVSNGSLAREQLHRGDVEFCILDVGLPDCNGFDLLKEIRQHNATQELPVMLLTARSEEIDRVVGLEIGADDYVCKPFSPREVVARVKVITKRTSAIHSTRDESSAELSDSDFEHHKQAKTISYKGISLPLTRSEYNLLATLLGQPGRVFSRRQLIDAVWSSNHPSDDRVIDTHVKTLRAKLRTHNPHQDFIKTQRGFGYSLEL